MADYRELIRVLQHREKGRPVFFQPYLSRGLWERLVWRSGETPWKDAVAAAKVYIDGSVIAGFDVACLSFSPISPFRADQNLLEQVEKALPPGLRVVDLGGAASPTDYIGPKTIHDLESYYRQVLASKAVCAVMVGDFLQQRRNNGSAIGETKEYRRNCHKAICDEAHRAGKYAIFATDLSFQRGLEFALEDGFDGFWCNQTPPSFLEEWRQYHSQIALLGGLSRDFLVKSKPMAIHLACEKLMESTNGQGFAIGSDDLGLAEIPYLSFIALAGYIQRHHQA